MESFSSVFKKIKGPDVPGPGSTWSGHQMGRIFPAAGPFGPCVGSYSTFWPSLSDLNPDIWISVWWAKRSLPPSSGAMNPKPFESLNHLTVPVAIALPSLSKSPGDPDPERVTTIKEATDWSSDCAVTSLPDVLRACGDIIPADPIPCRLPPADRQRQPATPQSREPL